MFVLVVLLLGLIFSGSTLLGESLIHGFIWVEYFFIFEWVIFIAIAGLVLSTNTALSIGIFTVSSTIIGINYLIVDYIIGTIPPNAESYNDLSTLSVIIISIWIIVVISSKVISSKLKIK